MGKLRPLLPYLRPYRKQLALGVFSIFATAAVGLLNPLVIGRAVDSLRGAVSAETLALYGGLVVLISLVQGVFQFGQRLVLVTMSRDIERDLRDELYAHLSRLEPAYFAAQTTGDLMARATNDLAAVRMVVGPAIMYGTNTVFTATGALVLMLDLHVGLTLLSLATLPFIAVVTRFFGRRIHVLFERVQEDFSRLSARVQESLAGARVVRAYVREAAEERAYEATSRQYVESNRRLIRWNAAFHPLLQGVIGFGFVAVLWYGGRLMIDGSLTVGDFVAFTLFLAKLAWPMIAIGWVINIVERGTASLGRIRKVLDRAPRIRDAADAELVATTEPIRGDVAFRHLSFAYRDGTTVLDDVDVTVAAGTTVAIVGRTGSGKSTLLSLVPRLLDPPPGALFVDDVDVRRRRLAELRRAIAMVPQESFLFSATIRENIAFGRPEADDEAVREAAHLAGLERDLAGFPRGLESLVGERGITLSGGQKQRVALARAILRRPRILLLDDCLSAVDAETEEHILASLRTVFPGRTVFFVSHRISAARTADLVLVLADGRVAERGRHDELVAKGGLYAELYRRQRLEEELAAV